MMQHGNFCDDPGLMVEEAFLQITDQEVTSHQDLILDCTGFVRFVCLLFVITHTQIF